MARLQRRRLVEADVLSVADEFRHFVYAKLAHDVLAMRVDGLFAPEHRRGRLLGSKETHTDVV